ncbi:MAG: anion permease [Oscillospiraceae bacterium]|nr:anion permease [Oscillospiraceae bacterium]
MKPWGSLNGPPVKLIMLLLFLVVGLAVALAQPFYGLDEVGNKVLGTMIAALATWIFRPESGTFVIGAGIIFLGGTLAGMPMSDLAVGFSSPAFWLLVPAMFLGAALMKTGLGKRMVYALFRQFNLTYPKILLGWFVVCILFALITPSATVRFLIATPIAVSVADACHLENGCRGRSLIVISACMLSIFPSIAWINGSLFGPMFSSFLPEGAMREMATPEMWFRVMAPWLLFGVVFIIALYFVLKPEKPISITREQVSKMYNELGPITKAEKGCLVVFVFLVVSLVLQRFFPFTTNQAILAAFVLLLLLGVLTAKDISSGVSWDTIMFFGVILSFVHIFYVSGITAWLTPYLVLLIRPIAFSPLLFILALYIICLVIRFIDVSQGWISSAILAMATPMLLADFGLHPLISIMVFICASCLFFFRYHQPWIVQVESVCGSSGWNPRHLATASILYAGLAVVFLVFCYFYWQFVGVL